MQEITSVQNPHVRALCALKEKKGRKDAACYLVEGDKMVAEALEYACVKTVLVDTQRREAYSDLLVRAKEKACRLYHAPAHVIKSVSDALTPQGILAAVECPKVPTLEMLGARILILDGVQDPGNVGTMLRTAEAAGCTGALLSDACADPLAPKTLRATMGAIFRLPWMRSMDVPDCLVQLRKRAYLLLASELGGTDFFRGVSATKAPWGLIIGSEAHGVSADVSAQATHHLQLPMWGGTESLNAAVAAGIMLYALAQVRLQQEERG